jgi:hypothetical protein
MNKFQQDLINEIRANQKKTTRWYRIKKWFAQLDPLGFKKRKKAKQLAVSKARMTAVLTHKPDPKKVREVPGLQEKLTQMREQFLKESEADWRGENETPKALHLEGVLGNMRERLIAITQDNTASPRSKYELVQQLLAQTSKHIEDYLSVATDDQLEGVNMIFEVPKRFTGNQTD